MRNRFFWIALGLIGISWTLNSIYAHSKKLDGPIFLDHYIDVELQDSFHMTFYYLTNKNDLSFVSSVSAGDLTGYAENFFPFEPVQNLLIFNNHVLRSFSARFDTHPVEKSPETGTHTFTEMDVYFSDGKKITAPIGIVSIRPYTTEKVPLEQTSSMGSADYNRALYRATESLTIESIKGSFQETLQDRFFIKLFTRHNSLVSESDEDFSDPVLMEWKRLPGLDLRTVQFPFDMKEQENLSMYSHFAPDFKAVLDLRIYISGTTESGETFSTSAGFIKQPYLEQKDVNEIIKRKTKEDTYE